MKIHPKHVTKQDMVVFNTGINIITSNYDYLQRADNSKGIHDLISTATGAKIKVTTADYALGDYFSYKEKVSNRVYMDTVGVDTVNEPGGPWYAAKTGNDYWCYIFNINKVLITIPLKQHILEPLLQLANNCKTHIARNRGYDTEGKLVPFQQLMRVSPEIRHLQLK